MPVCVCMLRHILTCVFSTCYPCCTLCSATNRSAYTAMLLTASLLHKFNCQKLDRCPWLPKIGRPACLAMAPRRLFRVYGKLVIDDVCHCEALFES